MIHAVFNVLRIHFLIRSFGSLSRITGDQFFNRYSQHGLIFISFLDTEVFVIRVCYTWTGMVWQEVSKAKGIIFQISAGRVINQRVLEGSNLQYSWKLLPVDEKRGAFLGNVR